MGKTARSRGRPRVGDPEAMSAIGLQLIRHHGWAATTMDEIARACDVSSTTLFRYFPTKAALLWHGMDENAALFRRAFADRRHEQDLPDAIFDAYTDMLRETDHLPLIKSRMAVVALDIDAAEATWSTHEQWRDLVIGFVAEHRGEEVGQLGPRTIGATIWAVLWAALSSWSAADDEDPARFVTAARSFVTLTVR